MTAYLPRVANLRLALIAFTISTMRNGIASILALTRLCYMLLRTWTEWWLNIRRHIKLAPSPQHLKQEKGKTREKKGGKRNLVDCENIRKGACLIFRSLGGDRPPCWGLWAGHTWYSPTGNSWSWNPTFVCLKDRHGMPAGPLQSKLFYQGSPGDCLGLQHLRVNSCLIMHVELFNYNLMQRHMT